MSKYDPIQAELQLLREFYASWVYLHTIPRDHLHRKKQETAAQELVDAGHALRAFYHLHPEQNPLKAQEKPRLEVVSG